MTRGSMLEVLRADYMRTARAKGLRERDVVARHGLRNAMLPVITLIGIDFGTVIGAAVLTETVFSWPGWARRSPTRSSTATCPSLLGLTLAVVIAYSVDQPAGRPVLRVVRPADPARARRRRMSRARDQRRRRRPALEVTEPGALDSIGVDAVARPLRERRLAAVPPQQAGHGRPRSSSSCWSSPRSSPRCIAPYSIDRAGVRPLPRGPVGRPLVRHRHDRPRRVQPGHLRRPRLARRSASLATLISLVIGLLLGAVAGFFGGIVDTLIMRITDIFLAIPYIVLAVAIASVFGRSENTVILVLGFTGWLGICRIVRASFLSLKQLEYVEAASALGLLATADHVPPHPAQRPAADHRLRHDRRRLGDPLRGGAVVPRGRARRTRRRRGGSWSADGKSVARRRPRTCCSSRAWPSSSPCWPSCSSATACATHWTRS